jgi:hypothetical protein
VQSLYLCEKRGASCCVDSSKRAKREKSGVVFSHFPYERLASHCMGSMEPSTPSSQSPSAGRFCDSPSSSLRSLPSPPDEVLQVALKQRKSSHPDKQQRTIPCQQCRSIRRVCKWVEGSRECERCLKNALVCSGPKRCVCSLSSFSLTPC